MKVRRFVLIALYCTLAIWSALSMAGCSSTGTQSGFLTRYDLLQKSEQYDGHWYYIKDGVDWDTYPSVMIDQVTVLEATTKDGPKLSPEDIAGVTQRFHKALVEAMKDGYVIADKPGPGVVRAQIALTHLKPVKPALNVASVAVLGVPVDVGEVKMESKYTDSVSGDLLAEWVAAKKGSYVDVTGIWTRWGQVDDSLKVWAKMLRTGVDETYAENREKKAKAQAEQKAGSK